MNDPRAPRLLRDPLAEALFPVLIHRLNNATQILSSLNAVLGAEVGDSLLGGSSKDLADASRDVHELGWLLGVLASAGGADLLLERREKQGLRILVHAVRDGLRRQGRDLEQPGGGARSELLPSPAPDADDGWQTPWAIGSVLWSAGCALARGETLRWNLAPRDGTTPRDGTWILACAHAPAEDELTNLAARIHDALPEARLATADDGCTLVLPLGALRLQRSPDESGAESDESPGSR